MVSTRGPATPAAFHAFFSTGVGAGIPICAHEHNGAGVIILLGLWAGMHLFMHARARLARGVFIDEKASEFYVIGACGFLFGLLFSSIIFVVIGK
jgi:hypothetical protein